MSEYWKSNPRKYCDFCKCWIADNKPSVEFHERGKRHKESVAQKLEVIAKKGKEDYENQLKQDDYFAEMEKAALEAYKKDIASNPDYTGSKIAEIADSKNLKIVVGVKKNSQIDQEVTSPIQTLKWHEAKSDEGCSYYWNTETGESVWEAPKEGFVHLEVKNKKKKGSAEKLRTPKPKKDKSNKALASYGPQPKASPYGAWEAAVVPETVVDLQLPEVPQEEYYVPEIIIKKPEIKFTEKTVSLGAGASVNKGPVEFKKRKVGNDHKKNVRQRTAEL